MPSDTTSVSERELLPADLDLLARLDKGFSETQGIPVYLLAIGEQSRLITYAEARYFSSNLTEQRLAEERFAQDQQRLDLNRKLTECPRK